MSPEVYDDGNVPIEQSEADQEAELGRRYEEMMAMAAQLGPCLAQIPHKYPSDAVRQRLNDWHGIVPGGASITCREPGLADRVATGWVMIMHSIMVDVGEKRWYRRSLVLLSTGDLAYTATIVPLGIMRLKGAASETVGNRYTLGSRGIDPGRLGLELIDVVCRLMTGLIERYGDATVS